MNVGTIKAIEGNVTLDREGWHGPKGVVDYLSGAFPIESISPADGIWGVALMEAAAEDLGEVLELNPAVLTLEPLPDGGRY